MDYQTTVSVKETMKPKKNNNKKKVFDQKPTPAFVGASYIALVVGVISFCVGLWNSDMVLNEKGYYFTTLLFGLFSVVSVQKVVRDRLEDIPVSNAYYGISWFTTIASIGLLLIGLWNADLLLSEKGFFGLAFMLSIFSVLAVQKNIRDIQYIDREDVSNED